MARHVADLSLLFEVIADEPQESSEGIDLPGMRAAWYVDDEEAPVSDEIKLAVISAATALAHAGVEMREARPPAVVQGSKLWVELFAQAATDQFWNLYRGRELEAGPLVADLLVASYREENGLPERARAAERAAKALVERERLREELLRWMRSTPLLLTPVGATVAFPHGTQRLQIGKHSMSVFRAFSYAQSFNVFGFPCVTVPIGLNATGLPIGVQIVGRPFAEKMVLAAAQALEDHLGGWQPPHFDEASMRNS
jgi:Asp-tRNA(Asn)/Glu-tRNA(Gln) amidotransferase A subunit family amidase